jgi:hypothetical protein
MPTIDAPSQLPARQTVPRGWRRQSPLPSQVPSRPQLSAADGAHALSARGASPAGTGEQVPGVAVRSHAWQPPVQALSQHTPDTQNPL